MISSVIGRHVGLLSLDFIARLLGVIEARY